MDVIDSTTPVTKIAKMDGVQDLPMKARVKFAKALSTEAKGNADEALTLLDQAIEALTS